MIWSRFLLSAYGRRSVAASPVRIVMCLLTLVQILIILQVDSDYHLVSGGDEQLYNDDQPAVLSKQETTIENGSIIPVVSMRRHNYSTLFPPFIFRTDKDPNNMHHREKRLVDHCRELNPEYQTIIFNDTECKEFVHQHYPEFSTMYNQFPKNVMRADLWRYLILHHSGGVYLDMDIECLTPIDQWGEPYGVTKLTTRSSSSSGGGSNGTRTTDNNNTTRWLNGHFIQAMIGLEFCDFDLMDNKESFGAIQFTQWAMASLPKHPIFYRTAEIIADLFTRYPNSTDPLQITGPAVFTQAVLEYLVKSEALHPDQVLYRANVVGDDEKDDEPLHRVRNANFLHCHKTNSLVEGLAILNKQAYGYHRLHPVKTQVEQDDMLIRHMFAGRWRNENAQ